MTNELNELASALAKAQSEMRNAEKDASNPFFKSNYTTLAAAWDAVRGPLTKNGLSVVQMPGYDPTGALHLTTILLHSSGQSLQSSLKLTPKDQSPQSIGSALSYGRRYSLMAMVGLASGDDDDDGNAAGGKIQKTSDKPATTSKVVTQKVEAQPTGFRTTPPSGELPVDESDNKRLMSVVAGSGWKNSEVGPFISKMYKKDKVSSLTRNEFNDLITHIEANPRPVR